jgi:hypothetical protein
MAVFEKNEDPYQAYGGDYGFSDESVFRSLLWKTFQGGDRTHQHVVWVTKHNMKRIDRSSRSDIRGLPGTALQAYFDVFPNRPLHECSTYENRLMPVHKYLGIASPSRDGGFLQACKDAGLRSKDWSCGNGASSDCRDQSGGSTLAQAAIDCILAAKERHIPGDSVRVKVPVHP